MSDIDSSAITGGGQLPHLAPDLTAPSSWSSSRQSASIFIEGIDPSAGLTTAVSISGKKGYIPFLTFFGTTAEDYTIKLTIDGEVIFDDIWSVGFSTATLIGGASLSSSVYDPVPFDDSFLLEIQSTTDTDIDCEFIFRELK